VSLMTEYRTQERDWIWQSFLLNCK